VKTTVDLDVHLHPEYRKLRAEADKLIGETIRLEDENLALQETVSELRAEQGEARNLRKELARVRASRNLWYERATGKPWPHNGHGAAHTRVGRKAVA
jgi:hypothetical protein